MGEPYLRVAILRVERSYPQGQCSQPHLFCLSLCPLHTPAVRKSDAAWNTLLAGWKKCACLHCV